MYLKEDSASKRGKYEHAPGAYPAYPPAAAPGGAPYYPPAAPGVAPAAAAANRQYVSGMDVSFTGNVAMPIAPLQPGCNIGLMCHLLIRYIDAVQCIMPYRLLACLQ